MKSIRKNIIATICIFFLICVTISVAGQDIDDDQDHQHDVHKYHLGFGIAGAHLSGEEGLAPGFHLHFIRQLGESQNWGLGLGYEAIVEENLHSGINLLANYHPFDFLSFNAGPGLVFGKHNGESETLPAFHTEAVFEFDLHRIHIGPMAGFGIDKEESTLFHWHSCRIWILTNPIILKFSR